MRHTSLLGSLLFATLLTACGGSDDTPTPPPPPPDNGGGTVQPPPPPPPEPPPPPTPPAAKCDVWHPTIPAGQTYAAVQTLDRLNIPGTERFSNFIASGTGIPTDKGYGQLHLAPNDPRSPVQQVRVQLIEFDDCPSIYIHNGYKFTNSLRSDETIRSFRSSLSTENPEIISLYILEVFSYGTSGSSKIEFHIDPSKYQVNQIFDRNTLKICTISFNYFDMYYVHCYETNIKRDGHSIVASTTLPGESSDTALVLASSQPRGFDSVTPPSPPPIFEQSDKYLDTLPPGHPEVCGPLYAQDRENNQGRRPQAFRRQLHELNDQGAGVFSDYLFFGSNAPDEYSAHRPLLISYLDAQSKRAESATIDMGAWADCMRGRMTNLQRNIHANETISSFARNKNFGGEMQYQNLHVLEGFAYSGFDPHIGKRVQFTIDSLRYPEAIQQAPKDVFRICKLSYQTTGTNLTCAKTQVRALSDYWTVYAEFDDPHIGQWIEHDEEYLLTATTPRGRDTLVTP